MLQVHERVIGPGHRLPGTWSKAEVKKFLAKGSGDRLHAAWWLSLYGLRSFNHS
jgi:hypothetical protein